MDKTIGNSNSTLLTQSNWHKLSRDVLGLYACTGWTVEDVGEAAKVSNLVIPEEAAIQFLIDYETKIVDAMVAAGFEAISYIIDATLADDPEVERRCECGVTFYALDQGHEDDRRCMKCIDAANAPEEEVDE